MINLSESDTLLFLVYIYPLNHGFLGCNFGGYHVRNVFHHTDMIETKAGA
jgi:hypothetical protein